MYGNAVEWCEDVVVGTDRHLRGGNYISSRSHFATVAACCVNSFPFDKGDSVGFRLARGSRN